MSLTNADIRLSLDQLGQAVTRAGKALADSDNLPPLDLAEVMVESMKLGTKLTKLADRIGRLSCPLLGPRGGGPDTAGESKTNSQDKPAGRKRKRGDDA